MTTVVGEQFFRVTEGPIPHNPLNPPVGDHDWVLSWSLDHMTMRLRLVEESKPFDTWESWYFKESIGDIYCTGCDHQNGRINLRGKLDIQGDRAYVWLPEEIPEDTYELAEEYPADQYRLCYRRPSQEWRIRRERMGYAGLIMVKNYRGTISLNWLDHGSHIFHNGPWDLDTDGVAHFK